MLQNGTVISGTMIEKPHSFSTACNIATQIIAQVASNQYGGQSISLTHLAPFVQVSREKSGLPWAGAAGIPRDAYSRDRLPGGGGAAAGGNPQRRPDHPIPGGHPHDHQRAGPLHHRVHVSERAKNEQEKKDLAVIIEEMLLQRCEGVKNESGVWITPPPSPSSSTSWREDNVREGTPYWYLTRLAAQCTAKRMVPDYISEKKKMLELKIDKNGEGHCYTCMGAPLLPHTLCRRKWKAQVLRPVQPGRRHHQSGGRGPDLREGPGEILEHLQRAPGAVPQGPDVPPQPAQGHPLRPGPHFVAIWRPGPAPEGRAHRPASLWRLLHHLPGLCRAV